MEPVHKLFGSLLRFVYHCFDPIVIQGYLPLLTRPEHLVHLVRDVHGVYPITKDALAKRTQETPYYLNGHHIIAGELTRQGVRFRKDDKALLWTADVQALPAAADRLDPEVIRQRLDSWSLVLGPKFSKRIGPRSISDAATRSFHHRPTKTSTPPAKIESAYHKADVAIQQLIELIAA